MARAALAACLLLAATAAATWTPPAVWLRDATPLRPDHAVSFRLGLKVDEAALDAAYHAVTDFDSPRRGAYLTVDELADAIAPPAHVVDGVRAWLLAAGVAAHNIHDSLSRDVLAVTAPVAVVERAFGLTMARWTHAHSGRVAVRATSPATVPAALAHAVDVVEGLSDFFETKQEQKMASAAAFVADRRAATAAGTVHNAPYIAAINGNTTMAQIEFAVFCLNGEPTGSATNPCSDVAGQPTVDSFLLIAQSAGAETASYKFNVAECNCHSSPVRPSLACDVSVHVPAWAPTNFTLTTSYSDGSDSQKFSHPQYRPRPKTTPQSLQALYNIPDRYRVATNPKNSQSVVSFELQFWSMSDLEAFWKMFDITPNPPHLVGFNNGSMPGGEATLDVQMVTGLGQGVNTTTWSFPPGDYIMNWAWAVGNNSDAPLTTSISYGDTEVGYQFKTGYGIAYIRRMNVELEKMATRGYTVFAGAGDAGWTNVGEMGNDLSKPDKTCGIMRAFYPSESPFVTSMSASFRIQSGEAVISVRGGRSWTTGGGFSNLTAVQDWQRAAVDTYLTAVYDHLPESTMFNRSGRGYSDLAAVGDNNIVVRGCVAGSYRPLIHILQIWNGAVFPLGGTSASGPIMAGIASLLNDVLLNNNMPPLGHLNPTLYRWHSLNPYVTNDITVGMNNDGDMQPPGSSYPIFCEYGFPAALGWDAASGLGSPNFQEMVTMALNHK